MVNDPPRRPPPSICLVPVHSPGCFAESMAVPRKRGADRISRLSHAIFSAPPPEVKGWESQTNRPCVSPSCVCMQRHGQASCQVLLLFPGRLQKKKTNPKLPSSPLPSFTSTPRLPLAPFFSLISAQKEGRDAKSERAQIRPSRWWRRPGRGEGRRGRIWGGVAVISRDRTPCPLPRRRRQLGRGVASFAFTPLVPSPSLTLSMGALCEPEEGYEVPFGCHWHVKRVCRWQLTRSVACN